MNRRTAPLGVLLGLSLVPAVALGQDHAGAPAAAPTPTPAPPPAPGMIEVTPVPVPEELLRVSPGGLTATVVGERAATTSFSVKQDAESLRAAAARVDGAWQAFLPKLRASGSLYLVDIPSPPSLFTVVTSQSPPGPITRATLTGGKLEAIPLALPSSLGSYLLQATIAVPISDYFLRIGQGYSSATNSRDAARYDLEGERAVSAANGRVTFYSWLRARGAVVVAALAVNDQKTHLVLAKNQYAVGSVSRADVLRAETDVASAELTLEQAKNLAALTEKQVRTAVHAKDEEALLPGESLEGTLPPLQGNLRELMDEATSHRTEVKSLLANAASVREQGKATRNAGYPSLSASANAIAANTNTANLGPSSQWFGIWYVGATLAWSPNDTGTQASAAAEAEHRASALEAQAQAVKDNIEIEVTQDFQNVRQADVSIGTAERELASAEEGYRVAKELFNNGRATSTQLTDAETDLTRARLDLLNAKANARTARVQLEHALGRDVQPVTS